MLRRRLRAAGWGLLVLAVVVVAVVVTAGALRAHGDAAFNRWVGWATVAAVPLGAIGIVLVLWEKIAPSTAMAEMTITATEDELAAVVLSEAQTARSRLIGADEAGDQAANVRFVKGGRFREAGGASRGDLSAILEYYQSLSPGRLVVLGEPGAGKTVLAIELLIRLLEHRQHDEAMPVPVLVSAAAYDTQLTWEEWLAEHLTQRFTIGKATATRLVRAGRVLPIIDGLDEMDPVAGEIVRAHALITALNASMRGRERAPVIVTCRRAEYETLRRGVDRATHVEMVPLNGNETTAYLREQFLDQDEEHRWEPVLAVLQANPGGPLAVQLATPWRLTLALAAFREDGDPAELLPATLDMTGTTAQEYAQHVNSHLLGRYVPAAIHLHDPAGRYSPRDVQRWLTAMADGLAWQAHHERSATDIRLDQWWEPSGRRASQVTHFTGVALLGLPWFIFGVISSKWLLLIGAGILSIAVGSVIGSPSPRRLRIRQLTTIRGVGLFAIRLTFGVALGLAIGLLIWLTGGGTRGLVFGLVFGLALGLAIGLTSGAADSSPQVIGPRDVIRADGHYQLAVGLALGLSLGLVIGLTFAATAGLAFGLTLTFAIWLAGDPMSSSGGNAWARYYISVMINAAHHRGPLRFGTFLNWAEQVGLLRVSGVAYQFRHRQLQDWLTSPLG
jgi:hypothetical protein